MRITERVMLHPVFVLFSNFHAAWQPLIRQAPAVSTIRAGTSFVQIVPEHSTHFLRRSCDFLVDYLL